MWDWFAPVTYPDEWHEFILSVMMSEDIQLCLPSRGVADRWLIPAALANKSSDYVHWYWKWNGEWAAYAILENVPPELIPRLRIIKELMEAHPWVEKLVDEDWTIIEDISRHYAT
jgi:hypothetical protein